jgi:hypothetical protein
MLFKIMGNQPEGIPLLITHFLLLKGDLFGLTGRCIGTC